MKNAFKISLLALALLSAHAQASEYRLDGTGFDIVFDDTSFGMFGTPTLAGNTLLFRPATFSAESTTRQWDITNSTITFWIEADANNYLTGASLTEQGDYFLLGNSATAFVTGETRVVDYRTPTTSTAVDITGAENFTGSNTRTSGDWEATSLQTFQNGASKVSYTIENLLFANAGKVSNYSFIEKKYVGLTVSAVPEPESWAMLLAGLGVMATVARRRAKSAARN